MVHNRKRKHSGSAGIDVTDANRQLSVLPPELIDESIASMSVEALITQVTTARPTHSKR